MSLLLANEDVTGLLTMPHCMQAMEAAFAERSGRHYLLKTCDAALPGTGLGAVRIASNMRQEYSSLWQHH
jgi:hypothetical protein